MSKGLESLPAFFNRMAERIEKRAAEKVSVTGLAIIQKIVPATPVDTGRARSNWIASKNEPVAKIRDEIDGGGSISIREGVAVSASIRGGDKMFITNSLPYIESLNSGSSKQAPAGFVETAVDAGKAAARKVSLIK